MRRSKSHTNNQDQLSLFGSDFGMEPAPTVSPQIPQDKPDTLPKSVTTDIKATTVNNKLTDNQPYTATNSSTMTPIETKEKILALLDETKRDGIEQVKAHLEKDGYFEAPASTVFHGNYHGGLADHSLNVCLTALRLREVMLTVKPELEPFLLRDQVIISALLHDVCKIDIYREEEKWRKDANNKWETYKTFGVNYSTLPLGHGEKSVIRLLQWGLDLREDEMIAIRWHMSAWDLPFQSNEFKGNLSAAQEKYPLLAIIQAADGLSTSLLDKKI